MQESSELTKAKDCPGGMHAHTGYTQCHPLDKPHRPGTSADQYHQQAGIENTWYKRHGTTREDYEKEHPKGDSTDDDKDNASEEEQSSDNDSKDYSKVEFKGIMQWDCNRELKSLFSTEYDRVEKAQRKLDSLLDNTKKTNVQIFREVMGEFNKGQKQSPKASGQLLNPDMFPERDIEMFQSPVALNKMPREIFISVMQESLKSIRECPFGAYAFNNITASARKGQKEIMHYSWREGDAEIPGFHFNMAYFTGEQIDNEPYTIINSQGEKTQWRFHFAGERTFADSINHEYGHSLDFIISALQSEAMKSDNPFKTRDELNTSLKNLMASYREKEGYSWDDSYAYASGVGRYRLGLKDAEDRDFLKEHKLVNQTELTLNHKIWKDHKDELNDLFKEQGYEFILATTEFSKENRITVYLKDTKEYKSPHLSKDEISEIKRKGVSGYCSSIDSYNFDNLYDNTISRIEECADLYKKIYDVDRIEPCDVYSGYGWAGPHRSFWKFDEKKDIQVNDPIDKDDDYYTLGSACLEKMAEAYSDVMLRQDRSNSMSRLIYAHAQYELHQLLKGYEGTFEDFVKDKIGMDKFKEKIVKSSLPSKDIEFIGHVTKTIQTDKMDTIKKHQAFISTISAQFNMKMHR